MRVPIPIPEQQKTIATTLRSVDETIDKTHKLITHLITIKNNLLGQLIFKGLTSSWELTTVGALLSVCQYGLSCKLDQEPNEGFPVVRMGEIQDGHILINPSAMKWVDIPQNEAQAYFLQDGDLLFNRTNSRDLVGKTGLVKVDSQKVLFASYLVRLRTTENNSPEWLNIYLNHPRNLPQLRRLATPGVQQWNINAKQLRRFPVARPPYKEQKAIAEVGKSFDRRIAAERAYLAQLQEVKRGLAQALLSGQVRVPERVSR